MCHVRKPAVGWGDKVTRLRNKQLGWVALRISCRYWPKQVPAFAVIGTRGSLHGNSQSQYFDCPIKPLYKTKITESFFYPSHNSVTRLRPSFSQGISNVAEASKPCSPGSIRRFTFPLPNFCFTNSANRMLPSIGAWRIKTNGISS